MIPKAESTGLRANKETSLSRWLAAAVSRLEESRGCGELLEQPLYDTRNLYPGERECSFFSNENWSWPRGAEGFFCTGIALSIIYSYPRGILNCGRVDLIVLHKCYFSIAPLACIYREPAGVQFAYGLDPGIGILRNHRVEVRVTFEHGWTKPVRFRAQLNGYVLRGQQ